MCIMNCSVPGVGGAEELKIHNSPRPRHRLGAVRRLQGVTRRTVARHLNIDVAQVKRQEVQTTDMSLSQLYEWQRVLDVPVAELLVDADDPLSAPVMKRAQLVRVMKTVLAIIEEAKQVPV